jgi:hypothetical protein
MLASGLLLSDPLPPVVSGRFGASKSQSLAKRRLARAHNRRFNRLWELMAAKALLP